MATTKQTGKALATQDLEDRMEAIGGQQEAAEATQSTAVAPDMGKARKTAPIAPKATSGNSQGVVLRIRDALGEGLYSKAPQAIEAAIEKIEAIPTLKTHPDVGIYKAEVLDYLRGKLPGAPA